MNGGKHCLAVLRKFMYKLIKHENAHKHKEPEVNAFLLPCCYLSSVLGSVVFLLLSNFWKPS